MVKARITRAWRVLLSIVGASIVLVTGHAALADEARTYRLGGPDVASELVLQTDGRFNYFLSAGSLDEHAEGTWSQEAGHLRLTTIPKPVAAVFSAGPVASTPDGVMELHVVDPAGNGIALVDFAIGFDIGDPLEGYTQDYGWTLDEAEARTPRWLELSVPIYDLKSPRFSVDLAAGNAITFILTPNDLGTVDFNGMEIDIEPDRVVMHRNGYALEFKAEQIER